MDILILAIILFMLISTSLIIYQVKWEPFFQNLRTLRSKLADSWEKAKQEVLLEEQEKQLNVQKKSLLSICALHSPYFMRCCFLFSLPYLQYGRGLLLYKKIR